MARKFLIASVNLLAVSLTFAKSASVDFEKIQLNVGGLVFDGLAAGPDDGDLVLLLHGFPQTSYSWRHQIGALAEAGYRAVAPNQRGYSPGARPGEVQDYALALVVQDVFGFADALGRRRFHLVGHDWGGAAAWLAATRHPERVLSLTVLATPHFAAFGAALADPDSEQAKRSSYFDMFAAPGAEEIFLANDAAFFRGLFQGAGLGDEEIQVYVDALGDPEAMRAALNWYTALVRSRSQPSAGGSTPPPGAPPPSPIQVPTLYIFGADDPAFSLETAEASGRFVEAPYRFVVLEHIGHWIPEQAADEVNALLLNQLENTPPSDRAPGSGVQSRRHPALRSG